MEELSINLRQVIQKAENADPVLAKESEKMVDEKLKRIKEIRDKQRTLNRAAKEIPEEIKGVKSSIIKIEEKILQLIQGGKGLSETVSELKNKKVELENKIKALWKEKYEIEDIFVGSRVGSTLERSTK